MKKLNTVSSAPNPFGILAAILIAIAFAFSATRAHADNIPLEVGFSTGGTLISSNLSYVPVPAGPGVPEVRYVSATSDTNTGTLTFYKMDSSTIVTNAATASTNTIWVADPTLFAANDVVLIRKGVATNSAADNLLSTNYQRLVILSSSTTNITFTTTNTAFALANGDKVYKMTSKGSIPVGNATKEVIGHCYTGREGEPLLVEVSGSGTNTVKLNLLNGLYR